MLRNSPGAIVGSWKADRKYQLAGLVKMTMGMFHRVSLHPKHPERICWGCDRYCPADDLGCGNGSIRAPHPCELFGDDWQEFEASRKPGSESPNVAGHVA